MLLDPERILTDQVGGDSRHTLLLGTVESVPCDPIEARIRVNPCVGEAALFLQPVRRPGRVEGFGEWDVHLTGSDTGDSHCSPPDIARGLEPCARRRLTCRCSIDVRAPALHMVDYRPP